MWHKPPIRRTGRCISTGLLAVTQARTLPSDRYPAILLRLFLPHRFQGNQQFSTVTSPHLAHHVITVADFFEKFQLVH